MSRIEQMREALDRALAPEYLEIADDSHLHKGHAGAAGGAGHYRVRIVCSGFAGLGAVARHRLVYEALSGMMPEQIHALGITAHTPAERAAQK